MGHLNSSLLMVWYDVLETGWRLQDTHIPWEEKIRALAALP
jgi:hypothetical protein